MQSGCTLNIWAKGTRYGKSLARNLSLESDDEAKILKFLREVPVKNLVDAQEALVQVVIYF